MADKKLKTTEPVNPEDTAIGTVTEPEDDEIDLYALLVRVVERWYWLLAAALVGALLAGIYSFVIAKPVYEATSKLYVLNNKDSAINLSDMQLSTYLANDYQEVFSNWHVHEMVMERLGLDYTYTEMDKKVSVTNPSNTRILYITVKSTSPLEAQQLANTYAEVAREFISVKMDTSEPSVFEEALLPTQPSSPNKTRNVILGFLLGFIVAAGVVVVMYLMDDYVRTADDVDKYFHLPTLGTVMMQADDEQGEDVKKAKKSGRKTAK